MTTKTWAGVALVVIWSVVAIEERSFVAALLRMTAKGGFCVGWIAADGGFFWWAAHPADYLVELLAFDPMQSDLRPNCAAAQFAKPPTLLRNAEWGTLRGDFSVWQEAEMFEVVRFRLGKHLE